MCVVVFVVLFRILYLAGCCSPQQHPHKSLLGQFQYVCVCACVCKCVCLQYVSELFVASKAAASFVNVIATTALPSSSPDDERQRPRNYRVRFLLTSGQVAI